MCFLLSRRSRSVSHPVFLGAAALFLVFGGAAPLVSCNLADGLTDVADSLGNPAAALIDHPGRKVAVGAFHHLLIDGSLEDGGQVVALEETKDGTRLAVIPYLEGEACYVEPALDFTRLSSRINVDLPGVVSVQETVGATGRGQVSFVNFSCERVLPSLEDAALPRVAFPSQQPRGLLSLDGSGKLILIEPQKDRFTPVAEGVSVVRVDGEQLWTLGGGTLSVRDQKLQLRDTMGDNVQEFFLTGGEELPVAYTEDGQLFVYDEATGPELLANDACEVAALGPDTIGYFEPCGSRSLVIYTRAAPASLGSRVAMLQGPEDVLQVSSVTVTWGDAKTPSTVLYLSGEVGASSGQLWLGQIEEGAGPQETADEDGDEDEDAPLKVFELTSERLGSDVALIRGQFYTRHDGVSGDLMELERDEQGTPTGLMRVAKNVAQLPGSTPFSPQGILTDLEDGRGILRVLTRDGDEIESHVLARDVPVQGQTVDPETNRTAFIGNSTNGSVGTLFLTTGTKPRSENLLAVSEHVLLDTARFLLEPNGVAYLQLAKDGSASLRTYLLEAELDVLIHPRVSEYRTVPWPAPGILYAVPEGKDQGLWYAKAR